MDPREDVTGLSKALAHRLTAMIEGRLLTYREYIPWADAVILSMQRPPVWILDLAVVKYLPDAVRAVSKFAHSEPFEPLTWDTWTDDYVASIYIRYARRELSWATFLEMSGTQADNNGGRNECEYFYGMLNRYEEANFAEPLEAEQRKLITSEYDPLIGSVRRTFDGVKVAVKRPG